MKNYAIIVAAIAVAAVGAWFVFSDNGSQGGLIPPVAASGTSTESTIQAAGEIEIVEMQMGNPDAPVTVIEYASYTCPHCASFHETTFKDLKAAYIDTGKINFIYREVYFDRPGLWASAIARCGGSERFFGITDLIYESQSEWANYFRTNDVAGGVDALRKLGLVAGLESDALDACLQNGEKMQALVGWYEANAAADNINSTPSLLINGTKHGNMSFSQLSALIDEAAGS